MRLPIFYIYGFPAKAEFSIRFDGIQYTYQCTRMAAHTKRIRRARALLIREKVITAQPFQYWKLNRNETHWTLNDYPGIRIPCQEVYWAISAMQDSADVETYHEGRITRWRTLRVLTECKHCKKPGQINKNDRRFICAACNDRLQELRGNATLEHYQDALHPERITRIADNDRRKNLRWLRAFVAEGTFTPSEFKALCERFGNVCLRCGRKRALVPDHVIPISAGGGNDITNIQPLCVVCNSVKGTRSTDYRRKRRTG